MSLTRRGCASGRRHYVTIKREDRTLSIAARPSQPQDPRRSRAILKPCGYVGTGGAPCRFKAAPGRRYCFWHDADAAKAGPLVGPLLIKLAQDKVNMEGFQLAGIDLESRLLRDAPLVMANLEGARLYRVDFENAHLFSANLKNANLSKASLANANLRSANLAGANLLGANISGARMEGADLGHASMIVNEVKANREAHKGHSVEARRYYHEAEEIYLALLNNFRDAGRNEEASDMFYRMMVVKRKLLPKFSFGRISSRLMDILCGYGERPMRIIGSSLLVVLIYTSIYFTLGIKNAATGDPVAFSATGPILENLWHFANCFYFSMVIITTTGYGDFIPLDATRWFAASEAFFGSFFMAVFIMVFTRKMMR